MGVLRDHLEDCHAYEYVGVCKKNGWPIKIKSLSGDHKDTIPTVRPHFTMDRLKTALVDWIVADDQVSAFAIY